jgi:putative SOS response-associated peptidase YedK
MPVMVHPENYDEWMSGNNCDVKALHNLLKPFPANEIESYVVITKMNKPAALNDESCIRPID